MKIRAQQEKKREKYKGHKRKKRGIKEMIKFREEREERWKDKTTVGHKK